MNSALRYISEVKSAAAAASDGGETYRQFLEALNQYLKRNIDSSIVISTVQTLFRENPNLLAGFRHFLPPCLQSPAEAPPVVTCAEFLNRSNLRSCADFVNRVGNRFNGGATYRKFLDFMHSYNIGETTAAALSDEIAALFEDHGDLYREFTRFLPKLPEAEAEKRKIEETAEQPAAKRCRHRASPGPEKLGLGKLKAAEAVKSKIEETAEEQSRRLASVVPAPEKLGLDKLKAAKRSLRRRGSPAPEKLGLDKLKAARENEMEDQLCRIDVMIGRLESARETALELCRRIFAGDIFPAGFRPHFTAVELVCLGNMGKKVLEGGDVAGMCELLKGLKRKKEGWQRERVRVVEMWNRVRKS